MLSLRRDASLLIAEGWSPGVAYALPLAVLWTEAELIRERINTRISTETIMVHAAITAVLGGNAALKTALAVLDG